MGRVVSCRIQGALQTASGLEFRAGDAALSDDREEVPIAWDSSILQTSRPERRRSLAMLGFESRHVDFGVQAPFDFGGIGTF